MTATTLAHILLALFILGAGLLFFLFGCTIKVEPIPKPKPVVVYRTSHHKKHHAHPQATPHAHLLEPEDGNTKLIPLEPTPHE